MASQDSGNAEFPTTAWTCIRLVKDETHPEHARAVDNFIVTYWKPIFYFLRVKNCSFNQAQDLTQEFFLRFVLERRTIQKADSEKGRFRAFLLTLLKRFLADNRGNRTVRQVRFEKQFVSISALVGEQERTFEPAAGETPEAIFNRHWAQAVLANVRRNLRDRFSEENRLDWVELFETYHTSETKRPSQESLASRFGLTRDKVRSILEHVKKRFDRLLRSEIREQVGSEADIDEEMRELLNGIHAN